MPDDKLLYVIQQILRPIRLQYEQRSILKTSSGVDLNSSSFTTIVPTNLNRAFLEISNPNATTGVFVNLKAAANGVDEEGIYIAPLGTWRMSERTIFTGEVSAIAVSGTPKVTVTEY